MKIVGARSVGMMRVYDLSVDHPHHSYKLANGVVSHNCAVAITDEPITNFVPTTTVGSCSNPVTMYTAPWVEEVGGLKFDFLGVNSLKDIQGAIRLVQKTHAYKAKDERIGGKRVPGIRVVPYLRNDGVLDLYDIWDLPEDQAVFKEICSGDTATVFQFSTGSAKQWLKEFYVDGVHTLKSIRDLATFTALDRPGPLDAYFEEGDVKRNVLQEFAARARGEKPIEPDEYLNKLLPETYGTIIFQEQTQKVFQEIGQATPEQADEFRAHVGKKQTAKIVQDREIFLPGAIKTLGSLEEAERMWAKLLSFSNYGFNFSHALCYSYTGYVCAWLKHHYPLEWWTAVLTNADRNEIDGTFWQHCGHMIDPPDIKLSGNEFCIQNGRIRAPLRLMNGLGEKAHQELCALRPFTDLRDFCQKLYDRRVRNGIEVVEEKTNKKGEVTKKTKLRLGRSALNKTILSKMIVSGVADSLFPPECQSVYEKLSLFSTTKAEIEKAKKPDPIDSRFVNLTPIQHFQLKKEILPSFSEDLIPIVSSILPKSEFRPEGDCASWKMPRQFEDNDLCPILHGKALRSILEPTGPLNGLTPKFKMGCIAYINSADRFWNNKAVRIGFEVNGERFESVRWPTKAEKDGSGQAKVPEDLVGSVVLLTLARWSADKQFNIDDLEVIQPALALKPAKEE